MILGVPSCRGTSEGELEFVGARKRASVQFVDLSLGDYLDLAY